MDEGQFKRFLAERDSGMLGEKYSPDQEPDNPAYNPKYIEAVQARQKATAPIGQKEEQTAQEMQNVADLTTTAGTATANPALIGAGLGLKALGMYSEAKQQEKRLKYEAEVAKATARQRAIDNLAALSSRLRV